MDQPTWRGERHSLLHGPVLSGCVVVVRRFAVGSAAIGENKEKKEKKARKEKKVSEWQCGRLCCA